MDRHLNVIKMAELYAADDEDFPADFPLSYAKISYRQATIIKLKHKNENQMNANSLILNSETRPTG